MPSQQLRAWAFVLYNDAAPPRLWHQRRVLGVVESSETNVLICTPDDDVYSEMLLDLDSQQDVTAVRFSDRRWPPPSGVPRAECYRFRQDLGGADLAAREADAVAPANEIFVAKERAAGRPAVPPQGGALKLLATILADGAAAPVGPQPAAAPAAAGAAAAASSDARILSPEMVTVPAGTAPARRRRPWRDAVPKFSVVQFSDWPIPGPRTVAWCAAFINRRGGGPTDHHLFFKQVYGLTKTDWGVDAHGVILRMLEEAGCYDGLDVANAAALEVAMRHAQLVEYVYAQDAASISKGKGKQKGASSSERAGLVDEASVFLGTHRETGEAMIAPDLLDYVAKEVERDASVMKQVRKAKERRLLSSQPAGWAPKGQQE